MTAPIDVVEVWTVPVRRSPESERMLASVLDVQEKTRLARMDDDAVRARFIAVHGAARFILAARLAVRPADIRWRIGPHGKPEIAGGPRVSLSHSGDGALVAVAERPVGVDIERIRARWNVRPPTRLFPAAEARVVAGAEPGRRAATFVRLHVRKEACVKASGTTMLPYGVRLPALGAAPLTMRFGGECWRVHDLSAAPGYGAAVAVRGADDFVVRTRTLDNLE
ncbi:4'-phosphopantetheinyl transferase superfamily protein [Actinoplanes sp. TBRC 11911]|uniref:4'-phosphopantetheinyl transferase family protein n=1 Tax=Actinoplanes sp. TBRC 11911 TaxID=2729386 RepID=UPI00145CAFCC|nr:4'-phosphopantetheinyl transferase superfamily protein [Actinoplanes sp. TBRC 11911]NMO53367.1 4'-phosphopantetheinyl transferase superfamily protein [Actinoplanes sp. TBRC 11911]